MEAVLTTFLAPLLPYLLGKGEKVAEQAIDAVGSAVWERARAIWARLRPKVEEGEAGRDAAEALAEAPEDAVARGALQFQLRKILQADPTLAEELGRILRDAQQAGIVADTGAVVIQGGVSADRGGVAGGRDVVGGQGGIHTQWQDHAEPGEVP